MEKIANRAKQEKKCGIINLKCKLHSKHRTVLNFWWAAIYISIFKLSSVCGRALIHYLTLFLGEIYEKFNFSSSLLLPLMFTDIVDYYRIILAFPSRLSRCLFARRSFQFFIHPHYPIHNIEMEKIIHKHKKAMWEGWKVESSTFLIKSYLLKWIIVVSRLKWIVDCCGGVELETLQIEKSLLFLRLWQILSVKLQLFNQAFRVIQNFAHYVFSNLLDS